MNNEALILEELLSINKIKIKSHFKDENLKNVEIIYNSLCESKILKKKNKLIVINKILLEIIEKKKINFKIIKEEYILHFCLALGLSYYFSTNENHIKKEENIDALKEKKENSDKIINFLIIFINKIYVQSNIILNYIKKEEININNASIRVFLTSILEHLAEKNILEKKNINSFKTIKFFFMKSNFETTINLELLEENPQWYIFEKNNSKNKEIYFYFNNFMNLKNIFRNNIYSEENFKINELNLLNKICETPVYIDKNRLNYFLNKLLVLNNLNLNNIKETYEYLLEKIKYCIESGNISLLKKLSKELSTTHKLLIYKNLLETLENKPYFLTCFFDFRGRFYYETTLTPTFDKIIRYCIYFGEYTTKEYETLESEETNEVIKKEFNKFTSLIEKNIIKYKELSYKKKEAIIWILISLGNRWEKSNKMSLEELISKGLEAFKIKEKEFKKINDFFEIYSLIDTIEKILNNDNKKWAISKDCTASVYQHSLKIRKKKNNESYVICNLNSITHWIDTYETIIEEFFKKTKFKELDVSEINNIFNRKNLKKTIMIKNYGAGKELAIKVFKEHVNIENFNDAKKKEITKLISLFCDFIEKTDFLCEINKEDIILLLEKLSFKVITTENCEIDLNYYFNKTIQKEIIIDKKRTTKKTRVLTDKHDKNKTNTALLANYTHTLDSAYARNIIRRIKCLVIHDNFIIDYMNTTQLILIANEEIKTNLDSNINNEIKDKIFSLFIII